MLMLGFSLIVGNIIRRQCWYEKETRRNVRVKYVVCVASEHSAYLATWSAVRCVNVRPHTVSRPPTTEG